MKVTRSGTIAGKLGSTAIRPTVVTAGLPIRCAVSITPETISAAAAIGSRAGPSGRRPAWFAVPSTTTR
jgi:hypothetical protein